MNNIKLTELSQLVDIFNNVRVPLSSKQRENLKKIYPYYGAQGIVDYVDDFLFDGEFILIAEDGENLRSNNQNICNLVNGKFWVNNHAHIVKANNENHTKYLYYNFNRIKFESYVTGSSQPKLNKENLLNIKAYVHENINDQKSIAKVLSDLDAKIELNNKINRELEAMAKTLFDYWFVQFDFPVDTNFSPTGEMSKSQRGYKSSGGKMVYNAELKREIPEAWEVKKLGEVLKTVLGGTPSTKNNEFWSNGEYYWLNSGEIANFPIITSELKITEEAILNSATSLMPQGTVVISITRHIRPSILAIEACANQSVIGILESDMLKSSYLYPFIINEVPRYLTLRTGAQQPHINKQTIDNTLIIIPKMEVLESYYKIVNAIYNQIINNSFQNQHLTALRDWLLPMLMNGQVKVSEL